jgi:hypothetical protein
MTLDQARETIRSKIPLIVHESEHDWQETRLHGCEICGWHEGFECSNCFRVVDRHTDWDLYRAIQLLGSLDDIGN